MEGNSARACRDMLLGQSLWMVFRETSWIVLLQVRECLERCGIQEKEMICWENSPDIYPYLRNGYLHSQVSSPHKNTTIVTMV